MLAPGLLDVSLSPLRLLLDAHGLRLDTSDADSALEQAFVEVRRALHCEIARTESAGPVEAENVSGLDLGHEERKTDVVTLRQEVGSGVQLSNNIMRRLTSQMREARHEGLGHFKRGIEGWCNRLLGNWDIGARVRDRGGRGWVVGLHLGCILSLGLGSLRARSSTQW